MAATKSFSAVAICGGILLWAMASGNPARAQSGDIAQASHLHFQVAATAIYSDNADAKEDIRKALQKAAAEHKRVILDFGGNWCGDCQVLNIYFHDPGNASLLAANYVLVDVNVGEYDKNLDLAHKYEIPLNKGVPALVVLDSSGNVVYAQKHGEFEAMRKLDSGVVTEFLEKWKPRQHAGSGHFRGN